MVLSMLDGSLRILLLSIKTNKHYLILFLVGGHVKHMLLLTNIVSISTSLFLLNGRINKALAVFFIMHEGIIYMKKSNDCAVMRTISRPSQFSSVLKSPVVLQQNKRTGEKGEEWWCWQW